MKLKERFNTISCKDCAMPYCDSKCTMLSDRELNKLEQIADEYAIDFAEWVLSRLLGENTTLQDGVIEKFKKEKGL